MSTTSQRVQSYFHSSAQNFDRLYHGTGVLPHLFNRVFRNAIFTRAQYALEECLDCRATSVLDVGCGSGVNSVMLAENGIENVVGVDFADGMLEMARAVLPSHFEHRVQYCRADFMGWEQTDRFDCVIALGVFDYLDRPRPFLEKMVSLSTRKVMFSVPGKGNLRQFVRTLRYRIKKCPIYFYGKKELEPLLTFENSSFRIRGIRSNGYLCVIDLDAGPSQTRGGA